MALAAAGCSSSGHPAASSTPPPATTPTTVPASTRAAATTGQPLSWYAAQYTRISKPSTDAQAALQAVTDLSQAQPKADALIRAVQQVDAALLRASWPVKIRADIESLIRAQGPFLGDLADVVANSDKLARDSGPANAAANILHADLGLPPVS